MGKIKSWLYSIFKKAGLTTTFLKLNFLRKQWLGIKSKDFPSLTTHYSQFIKPDSLVFDIGTNVGNRSEVFLALGSKVICVEPNRKLFDVIRFRFSDNQNVIIVNAGCGAQVEMRGFRTGSNHLVSSFSQKFIEHKKTLGENKKWSKPDLVKITTLDQLVSQYGNPDFCKIDVEGFEKEVLEGLSTKIGTISFEFTSPTFNDETAWCLKKLASLGYTSFNISFGESLSFVNEGWISAEQMIDYISTNPRMKIASYGDIYGM